MENAKKSLILSHILFLFSLCLIYTIPFAAKWLGDWHLPPMTRPLRFYIIGVFTIAFIFYYLFLRRFQKADAMIGSDPGLKYWLVGSTAAVFLFLCTSGAVISIDLYEYSIRGRMFGLYGMNPYLHTPEVIRNDIFYPLIFWKDTPECYGPLWVLTGALHTLPFRESVFLTSFLHKLVIFFFLAVSGLVFYRLCGLLKVKTPALFTAAFIANPMVVVMTVVDGHNEIAMVALFLAALYLLQRERYTLSLIAFTAAVQVKFVYAILLPLFLVQALFWPGAKPPRRRLFEVLWGGALSLGLMALVWLPFGWRGLTAVIEYYGDLGGLFWADSIPYAAWFVLEKLGRGVSQAAVMNVFSAAFFLIYAASFYYFSRNVRTGERAFFNASSVILLGLLFTNYSPFQTWYLLWVLPLLLLSDYRARFLLSFLLSYFLLMTFWKRMSVLAAPMLLAYLVFLARSRAAGGGRRFIYALEGNGI